MNLSEYQTYLQMTQSQSCDDFAQVHVWFPCNLLSFYKILILDISIPSGKMETCNSKTFHSPFLTRHQDLWNFAVTFTAARSNMLFIFNNFVFTELGQLEDLNTNRITRILTTDFPQYFAIVSRIRQEVHVVGPEGATVNSTVVPQVTIATKTGSLDIWIYEFHGRNFKPLFQVQAVFPQGALQKKIKVGLQVNMFRPRRGIQSGLLKKITVNHLPKKKRFSLIW